jgi:hypothetical protein
VRNSYPFCQIIKETNKSDESEDQHIHLFNTQHDIQTILSEGIQMSTATAPSETNEAKPTESDVSRYRVRLIAENQGEAEGELIRFTSPITVDNLAKALPFEGRAARWKEEIYFETPVKMGTEKAKSKVDVGTLAYWPMGSALCIFYGPTEPYSPVNVVGKVTSNLEMFRTLKSGTKIRVEKV